MPDPIANDPPKTDPPADPPKTDPPKTDPPADPPKTDPPAGDPPKDPNEPLGSGGIKALQDERDARKKLEAEVAALAPLKAIAEALGVDPNKADNKSDVEQLTERLTKHETDLAAERDARLRAEVALEKKLTAEQARRLQGSTREELTADADELLKLFPASGTPRPDPSQGGQGGSGVSLDTRIKEAQDKGDWRTVIALQNQKLADAHTTK